MTFDKAILHDLSVRHFSTKHEPHFPECTYPGVDSTGKVIRCSLKEAFELGYSLFPIVDR